MCRLISGSLSNPIPREGKTEIYIYKALRQSVCQSVPFCLSPGDKQFVCPPGNKHFSKIFCQHIESKCQIKDLGSPLLKE